MRSVCLFAEDAGHEEVIGPLMRRVAEDAAVEVELKVLSATGGRARMLDELRRFVAEMRSGRSQLPDVLVAASDANCEGHLKRRQEIEAVCQEFLPFTVPAVPDPHIERWLLLDSRAFKLALGQGCAAPDQKCNKDRYKRLLRDACRSAGVEPLLGGLEHAKDIVSHMDLGRVQTADESFGRFVAALRDALQPARGSRPHKQ